MILGRRRWHQSCGSQDLGKVTGGGSRIATILFIPLSAAQYNLEADWAEAARKSSCADARFVPRIPSSAMAAAVNRRTMNTTIGSGFGAAVAVLATRHYLPAALLSPLWPLQLHRSQSGAPALLPGRSFLGSRGAHSQRPGSRGRPLDASPLVPESGFFPAAVFVSCARRCWP